jgi:type I restriction enzyme S subunit
MSERSAAVEQNVVRDVSPAYQAEHRESAPDTAPPGYKWTEVGVIPEDWTIKYLGDIGTFLKGKGVSRDSAQSGSLACVRYGEIYTHHDDYIRTFYSRISKEVAETATPLRKGDLLFAGSGETKEEIGKCVAFVSDEEAYAGGDIVILRPRGMDSLFLGYALNTSEANRQKVSFGQGDAVVHISARALAQILLPVPDVKEQRGIATALSDADTLIESLDCLIAKKCAIKQATMQQLLTGQTRLPGFTDEWKTKRLGDVADIQSGGTPSTTNSDFWNGGVAWCTPTDITALQGRKYLSKTERTISDAGLCSSSAEVIPAKSIIMTTRATIGECAINTVPMTTNQGFKNLIPLEVDGEFLYYLMTTQKERLIQLCAGSTFLEVGKKQLHRFEVRLPPDVREQRVIASVFSDMDAEIEALERRRDKARQIRQGMMQQLLTGRVRLVKAESIAEHADADTKVRKSHSWAFNEAVVISTLTKHFGSEGFPLGRKRYTKLSYLFHRHTDGNVEDYFKKAAGPYNPKTKYGGPEKIAQQNGYIRRHKGRNGHSGFIGAENVVQAEDYFEKWYGPEAIQWLEQFRFKKNDELELLATVDMAAEELLASGGKVDVAAVEDVIANHPEWKSKLDRPAFSDAKIADAIEASRRLFNAAGGMANEQ